MTSKSRLSHSGKRKSGDRKSSSNLSDRSSQRDSLRQSKDDTEPASLSDRDSISNPLLRQSTPSQRDLAKDSPPSVRSTVQRPTPKASISPAVNSRDTQELNENSLSTEDTEQQLKILQHFSKPSPFLKGRRAEIRDMLGTLFVTLGCSFESAQVAKKSLYALKESKLQQLNASLKAVLKGDLNSAKELLSLLSSDNPIRTLFLLNPEALRALLTSIPNTIENFTQIDKIADALSELQNVETLIDIVLNKQFEILNVIRGNDDTEDIPPPPSEEEDIPPPPPEEEDIPPPPPEGDQLNTNKRAELTKLAKERAQAWKQEEANQKEQAKANAESFKLSVKYVKTGGKDTSVVASVASASQDQQDREQVLKAILWENHLQPLGEACKRFKYTIAIRETGALSVKRIAEGSKPKPHTILEKSIKKSSVEKYYKDQTATMMERLKKLDLDGFVGHWDENGKLLGVRVDGAEETLREKDIRVVVTGQAIAYVPFDIENSQELENSTAPINQLKQLPKWQTLLYTGDYDLHEAYSLSQGMHGQIAEATVEKRNLLNRLNQAIARVDPTRTGEAKLEGSPARIHGEGDYAMFQHGDQATYPTNQIFEALEAQQAPRQTEQQTKQELQLQIQILEQKLEIQELQLELQEAQQTLRQTKQVEERESFRIKIQSLQQKLQQKLQRQKLQLQQPAKLVKAVASESNEPMAWCVRGEWYVTMNIEEHDKLRKFIGVTKPSAWNPETIAKIEKSKSKAFTFGGPPPRPRRNILDLIKLDLNKKAAQESRPIATDVSLPSSNNQDN